MNMIYYLTLHIDSNEKSSSMFVHNKLHVFNYYAYDCTGLTVKHVK